MKNVSTQPLEMFRGDDLILTDLSVSHVAATLCYQVVAITSAAVHCVSEFTFISGTLLLLLTPYASEPYFYY